MSTAQYGRGLIGLWRRGWIEVPHVLTSSLLSASGFCMGVYGLYQYYINDKNYLSSRIHCAVYKSEDASVLKTHYGEQGI